MRRKTTWLTTMAIVLLAAAASAGDLDGMTFAVMVDDPGADEPTEDTLIFEDGMFRSVACDEYGFDWASYSTEAMAAGIVRFEATAESEEEGSNHWVGKVFENRIEGTFTWTKEGQDPIEYSFAGAVAEDEESMEMEESEGDG